MNPAILPLPLAAMRVSTVPGLKARLSLTFLQGCKGAKVQGAFSPFPCGICIRARPCSLLPPYSSRVTQRGQGGGRAMNLPPTPHDRVAGGCLYKRWHIRNTSPTSSGHGCHLLPRACAEWDSSVCPFFWAIKWCCYRSPQGMQLGPDFSKNSGTLDAECL